MSGFGLAKKDRFQFSMATLMVAPQADQVSINETAHALGLVKNVAVESTPGIVDLTQGVFNDVVASQTNDLQLKVSAEIYEFTAKNLMYGLGLDPSTTHDPITDVFPLAASVSGGATTATVSGDETTEFAAGKWIYLQEGTSDKIHVAKIASSAFSTNTTITFTGFPVPTDMTFSPTAGRVGVFHKIDVDPNAANKYFSVRIAGALHSDKRPIIIHFPKVRISKGFAMNFMNDNFGNLPFEITPMTPLSGDPGYSADFPNRMHLWTP